MGRSTVALKRLRKTQKAKKRAKRKDSHKLSITVEGTLSTEQRLDSLSTPSAKGEHALDSNEGSTSTSSQSGHDGLVSTGSLKESTCNASEICKASEQRRYVKLEKKLEKTIQEVYHYRRKYKEEEQRGEEMREEFRQRIILVREFWRNKIYLESTRAGRMVKMCMQN